MFNSTEWEGNSKSKLREGFSNITNKLDSLKSNVEKYKNALSQAQEISTIQDTMENSIDVDALLSDASSIESKISSFKDTILGMNVLNSESYSGSLLSTSNSGDDFGTGLFSINPQKFAVARDSFNDFSSMLKTNYDSFLSLQSLISNDSYLYYGWGVICSEFDELMKKRDSMENWIENFISSMNQIENSLPEIVRSSTNNSTNTYAKTHKYPDKPSFDTYVKNGRTSEIEQESSNSSSSGDSSSSSSGSSGGSYGDSSNDSNKSRADTSGSYASTYKGLSDYERAKKDYYAKKTDTSGSYASTYKGLSDYEKAKNIATAKTTISNPHGNIIYDSGKQTIGNPTKKGK